MIRMHCDACGAQVCRALISSIVSRLVVHRVWSGNWINFSWCGAIFINSDPQRVEVGRMRLKLMGYLVIRNKLALKGFAVLKKLKYSLLFG